MYDMYMENKIYCTALVVYCFNIHVVPVPIHIHIYIVYDLQLINWKITGEKVGKNVRSSMVRVGT